MSTKGESMTQYIKRVSQQVGRWAKWKTGGVQPHGQRTAPKEGK